MGEISWAILRTAYSVRGMWATDLTIDAWIQIMAAQEDDIQQQIAENVQKAQVTCPITEEDDEDDDDEEEEEEEKKLGAVAARCGCCGGGDRDLPLTAPCCCCILSMLPLSAVSMLLFTAIVEALSRGDFARIDAREGSGTPPD